MKFSKHNIFSKLRDSSDAFLLNILSGNADILTPEKASEIISQQYTDIDEYIEKGYLIDPEEEGKLINIKYLDFLKQRDNDEIQIFFVPRYSCNFCCPYCFQSDYSKDKENKNNLTEPKTLTKEVVDAFYNYIDIVFRGEKKYITLFGGEPLLTSPQAKQEIEWLLEGASQRNLDIAIVTNGFHLVDYLDTLKTTSIREIQVTLDGTKEVHDRRRFLANHTPTFQRIVEGIDAALDNNFPINLRVVVDKENIHNLKDLAIFAIEKGWTNHPLFKTQIGRNYELHTCQNDNERLFSRLGLYEELYKLIKEFPRFLEFHKPAFSIAKYLFEKGEVPEPLFDSCPGTKTEWAFDFTGNIYACTATVGKKGEELGTFYPTIALDEDTIDKWENRDVTTIPQCKDCSLQLACGGGCAAVAKNKTGNILSPDCRPIKECLEMGIATYIENE